MKPNPTMENKSQGYLDTWITSRHKVKDYERLREKQDVKGIAKLVRRRLNERYLDSLKGRRKVKDSCEIPKGEPHGFAIVAVCCLLIETLQCFREGVLNSHNEPGRSHGVFSRFFSQDPVFKNFGVSGGDFCRFVRNAILHQAETYAGWKIRRNQDSVFGKDGKHIVIDADLLAEALSESVKQYYSDLAKGKWEDKLVSDCVKKLDKIVENCRS